MVVRHRCGRSMFSPTASCSAASRSSLAFAALLIYVPPPHGFFGTAALTPDQLPIVTPFPFIVWGAEVRPPVHPTTRAGQRAL